MLRSKIKMNLRFLILSLVSLILMASCTFKESKIKLPAIFSDNLVLQRNAEVTIWGTARPGSKVMINLPDGSEYSTKTAKDSTWMLKVKTGDATKESFDLSILNDDSVVIINNVLIGEVWFCSGQSNMEMPLQGWPPNDTIQGSAEVIADASYPDIRMFTVVRNVSPEPLDNCVGSWQESNPQNAPYFSATAFFFGRKLHEELNVPIGLIHSSWGGTPVESWMSGRVLKDDSDFGEIVSIMDTAQEEMRLYDEWLYRHPVVNLLNHDDGTGPLVGLDLLDSICYDPKLNDNNWSKMILPSNIESTEVGDFDGAIWFRKEVMIPQSWGGKILELNLGPIDDCDVTYFNGNRIGGYEEGGFWQVKRVYDIPSELVKVGKAIIAVRMIDPQGGGGIYGDSTDIYIVPKGVSPENGISLAGEWKYRVVGEYSQDKFYVFDPGINEYESHPKKSISFGPFTATSLYNAMIAPLIPYTIKGAIWYQGEANVGRATQYSRLFPMMIMNWREDFNNPDMPFYYVQLAPWKYGGYDGTELGALREAQRRTLSLANTGMAVTLDIGNYENIHPCNKKDVGERLARWALVETYGRDGVVSGPLYKEAVFENGYAKISFDYTNGGLKLDYSDTSNFEIAGPDGEFYPAEAMIKDNQVWVKSKKVKNPLVVRYAYRNGQEATLFNGDGLPASSFTSSDQIGY